MYIKILQGGKTYQPTYASKQAVAGTTRDIILTILETMEIIRKPVSATSQSISMAA